MSLKTLILSILFYKIKALPSLGCGKPYEINESTFSQVFINTITDPLLGQVDREFIIQFPPYYDNEQPLPLVFDVHGYQGSASGQQTSTGWSLLAEQQDFLVVWPNGMGDDPNGWNSWNVSKTVGPKGLTCDASIASTECYYSCPDCKYDGTSCDWSSCYDDVYFFQWLLDTLTDTYCIDLNQIHYSGYSNGGMLAYYIASTTNDALGFATINPVAASSLNGYGTPPPTDPVNFSIIDFHGFEDTTIPYNQSFGNGIGPENTVIGFSGYYWDQKPELLKLWSDKLECLENEVYVTPYDGQSNFHCLEAKCSNQKSIVQCTGDFGHAYPLPFDTNVATKVAYQFMVNHPRQ